MRARDTDLEARNPAPRSRSPERGGKWRTREVLAGRGSPGQVMYRASYQSHPSALAKWDDGYCELQDAGDTLCFPRVVQHVGYTHDWNGRRLRTNYGRQLPSGYVDPNVG